MFSTFIGDQGLAYSRAQWRSQPNARSVQCERGGTIQREGSRKEGSASVAPCSLGWKTCAVGEGAHGLHLRFRRWKHGYSKIVRRSVSRCPCIFIDEDTRALSADERTDGTGVPVSPLCKMLSLSGQVDGLMPLGAVIVGELCDGCLESDHSIAHLFEPRTLILWSRCYKSAATCVCHETSLTPQINIYSSFAVLPIVFAHCVAARVEFS